MSNTRVARATPQDNSDPPERSRLGRAFGPSLLIALTVVLVVLLTVGRVVPVGPVGALATFVLAWFAALVVMLRWRVPAPPRDGRDG
jgi:hypothetical protein